jgi:hypothetical protein
MGEELYRVYKFTYRLRELFLSHLRAGCKRSNACKLVGVSRMGLHKFIKKCPEFLEEIELSERLHCEDIGEKVELKLEEKALAGHYPSMISVLKRYLPKRWSAPPQQDIDMNNTDILKRIKALLIEKAITEGDFASIKLLLEKFNDEWKPEQPQQQNQDDPILSGILERIEKHMAEKDLPPKPQPEMILPEYH